MTEQSELTVSRAALRVVAREVVDAEGDGEESLSWSERLLLLGAAECAHHVVLGGWVAEHPHYGRCGCLVGTAIEEYHGQPLGVDADYANVLGGTALFRAGVLFDKRLRAVVKDAPGIYEQALVRVVAD